MENNPSSQEGQSSSTRSSSKLSTKNRNDLKWDPYKDEIYLIYVAQNNTLRENMQIIGEKHGFSARLYSLICTL
jgi:hypothetical protein